MIPIFAVLAALAAPARAIDRQALADHIRETYQIPSGVAVSVGEPKPSDIPGFDMAEVRFERGSQGQNQTAYISKDGKHYLLGAFKDLSVHPDQERIKKMDLSASPVRGNAKSPITLVEYTDFQCPFCQRGYDIMKNKIMKDYGSQVRWIYKSLPLKSIHPWAEPAAIGAECAHQQSQEKFWKVHDAIFEAQRDITQRNFEEKLLAMAKAAGVDEKRFATCTRDKASSKAVERDLSEAEALGINGTPAFVVNGRLVSGADYDGLKELIDDALKGKHGAP